MEADERHLLKRSDLPDLFSESSAPSTTLISRPGHFKLLQRSNKPEAKAFDRWVRHEVLPQIMDTSGYRRTDHIACFSKRSRFSQTFRSSASEAVARS